MSEKRRFLDVWIVESNTVYREVPFEVVTDWAQQGRLIADDMLRWSGKADWFKVGGAPFFDAYLPKVEAYRVEDRAEALEPAHFDFAWKRRHEEEEGDVDMIPLIDVSLVLLIFFMMTAGVAAFGDILTPPAKYTMVTSNQNMLWVGIDRAASGDPRYSIGKAELPPAAEDKNLTQAEVLQRLDARLQEVGKAEVNIKADLNMPSGVVRNMIVELEKRGARVPKKYYGVSEPK